MTTIVVADARNANGNLETNRLSVELKIMSEPISEAEIKELVVKLSDEDALARQSAREKLVEIGTHDVTRALIIALNDPRQQVRWESAKALVGIGDPIAASALVHHLNDTDSDVRWLAAEGVAELGEAGLLATLNAAIRNANETEFCRSVHHAFKEFKKHGTHRDKLDDVMKACEKSEPAVHLPVAALKVIEQICD